MPIINHGQAAIITLEAITKRPVVVGDDAIAVRSVVNICLSFDHRILDGHQAAAFLRDVKKRLEALRPGLVAGMTRAGARLRSPAGWAASSTARPGSSSATWPAGARGARSPTRCCSWSTRPCTPPGVAAPATEPAPAGGDARRAAARDGPRRRHNVPRPRPARRLPDHRPARSRARASSPTSAAWKRRSSARSPATASKAGTECGLTGVWVGRREDRRDRRAGRQAGGRGGRLGDRPRPRAERRRGPRAGSSGSCRAASRTAASHRSSALTGAAPRARGGRRAARAKSSASVFGRDA